jgi:HD-like signal output (HDOD) protein
MGPGSAPSIGRLPPSVTFTTSAMSVNPELRSLDIDIPSQPQALVQLSLLLAEEDINLQSISSLIETDMALAAAVLKAVNSSLYGLRGRVQSVQQAITYLGMREVAAITFEMGLRAAFPPAVELEPVWKRAAVRGLMMGRLGQRLSLDAWAAHSAGLFEECGKAVLFRHAPDHYRAMLRAAGTGLEADVELLTLEHAGFGVSHDALGAALCESWGLGAAAVASVRHHVSVQATLEYPPALARRSICALSAVVHVLMDPSTASTGAIDDDTPGDRLDHAVVMLAPGANLDPTLLLRAARQVQEQLGEAAVHGRDGSD